MKNKKKIIVILVILAIICIASYFIYSLVNYKYEIVDTRNEIKYCKKKDCGFKNFGTLEFKSNFKIDAVNKKLDEFNKLQKDKVKDLNKDFSSDKCKKFKDTYNYTEGYNYYYYSYVTDKYISLNLYETKLDFCSEPYSTTDDNYYKFVYDVENKKFLSDSDILKKVGLTSDYILNFIHLNNDAKNVTKYSLYIDYTGDIYVKYLNDKGEDVETFINKKIDYTIR